MKCVLFLHSTQCWKNKHEIPKQNPTTLKLCTNERTLTKDDKIKTDICKTNNKQFPAVCSKEPSQAQLNGTSPAALSSLLNVKNWECQQASWSNIVASLCSSSSRCRRTHLAFPPPCFASHVSSCPVSIFRASYCSALISWSLNATGNIVYSRHAGSGEPVCPNETFAPGYLFGTMITGQLLIGICLALVYRQIQKTLAAVQGPQRLHLMIFDVGKTIGTQTVAILERKVELSVLKRDVVLISEKLSASSFGDQGGQTG